METEHTETVVEKAVAYVKDMFGLPSGDKTPHVEPSPVAPMTAEQPGLTSDDAMRLDPPPRTFKSVGDLHTESARSDGAEDALSPPERRPDLIAPGL